MKHIITSLSFIAYSFISIAQTYIVDENSSTVYVYTKTEPTTLITQTLFDMGFTVTFSGISYSTNWSNFPDTYLKHQFIGLIQKVDSGYIVSIKSSYDNSVSHNISMQAITGYNTNSSVQIQALSKSGNGMNAVVHKKIFSRMIVFASLLGDPIWFEQIDKKGKCTYELSKIMKYRK